MARPLLLLLLATTAAVATYTSTRPLSLVLPRRPASTAWLNQQQHQPAQQPPSPARAPGPSSSSPASWFRTREIAAYGAAGRGRRGQHYGGRGGQGSGRRGGLGGGGQDRSDLSTWTNRLLALNVAIFFLQQVNPSVTLMGAKNDQLIRRGEFHRFFTPMLLHGDLQHLMANSYTMYNLGHFIEPLFGGGANYLALYVLSGVAGNYLSFASGRAPISIGASTAVSGLLGAVGLFCYRHRNVWNLEGPLRSVAQAVVINGVLGMSSPRIDNFGHLGGLIGGVLCGYLFGPRMIPVHTEQGTFRGYVNQPILQTAYQSLRRRLNKGRLGKEKQGWGAGQPQQRQQKQKQVPVRTEKAPAWWQRLGAFLHRGGGGGGGRGAAAFVSGVGGGQGGQQQYFRVKTTPLVFRRTPYVTGVPLENMYPRVFMRRE